MRILFSAQQRKELKNKLRLLDQVIKLDLKACEATNNKPFFMPFFISANANGLFLEYDGYKCKVCLMAAGEIQIPGQASIPYREIGLLQKALGSNETQLCLYKDGTLHLKDQHQELNLTLSQEAFILDLEEQGTVVANLSMAIKKVRYAASKTESFMGVQLEFSGQRLKAVTTDGFRIAMYEIPCGCQPTVLVVQDHMADALCVLFEDAEVKVNPTPKQLEVYSPTASAAFTTLELGLPDYNKVIPQGFTQMATLEAQEVVKACTNIVTGPRDNYRITLSLNEHISIRSEKEDKISKHTLSGTYAGPPCEVSFMAIYLKEAFAGLRGPTNIYLKDNQPAFIEQDSYSAVLVPLKP